MNLKASLDFHENDYHPFGMLAVGRNWESGSEYRYGFNGMESENDIAGDGMHYSTLYRMYDSRLGRWLSFDPKSKSFESPYSSFSNSPIIKIDPNGDSDYYTEKGKYIGSDGTNGTDIIVVTDKSTINKIKDATKEALKTSDYAIYSEKLDEGSFFVLPSYADRQEIKSAMNGFDQASEKGQERGGRGLKLRSGENIHLRSKDGSAPSPSDPIAHIDLTKTHASEFENKDKMGKINVSADYTVTYTWHAHPNVTWYSIDNGNTWMTKEDYLKTQPPPNPGQTIITSESYTTMETTEGASDKDLTNPDADANFILTPKFDKVYYYDKDTKTQGKSSEGEFPLDLFYDTQAKTPPK